MLIRLFILIFNFEKKKKENQKDEYMYVNFDVKIFFIFFNIFLLEFNRGY